LNGEKSKISQQGNYSMIDPITALAGIQSAVALIKKVSKTVDDVASLGPVLGKYFDAKSTATKAAVEAKNSSKKSNMATAIEIELALHQAEQFERELQMLFMTTGKIDVWNKIKQRSAAMDIEAAHDARRTKAANQKKKEQQQEQLEWALGIVFIVFCVWGLGFVTYEFIEYCQQARCGK
jgi:hypothetical protein